MKQILIVCCVGDGSMYKSWMNAHTNADFFTIYYGNSLSETNYIQTLSRVFIFDQSPSKTLKIYKHLQNYQSFLSEYEHIWLPDDDLWIDSDNLNSFFDFSRSHKLVLSQPATLGFGTSRRVKKFDVNLSLAFTDWVEVMAPFFRMEEFLRCFHTYGETTTGWGIELVWSSLIGYPKDSIGIVHEHYMIHTRRVESDFSRFSISGWEDKNRILNVYSTLLKNHKESLEPVVFDVIKSGLSPFAKIKKWIKSRFLVFKFIGIGNLFEWFFSYKVKAIFKDYKNKL